MLYQINIKNKIIIFKFLRNNKEEIYLAEENKNFFINNDEFEFDISVKNLSDVFKKIQIIDGTVKNIFEKNNTYTWNIDLNNYPKIINRFKSIIPYIIRKINKNNPLLEFQKNGIKWLLADDNRILADDMGLGKTLQALKSIENLIFIKKVSNILIFCPNTLVKNWSSEILKWVPLITYEEVTSLKNVNDINFFSKLNKSNILILPYSLLEKIAQYGPIKTYKFDLIVADEAHKLRNKTSKIHENFCKLNKTKTWLLTGTPLERDINDIQNILYCLNKRKFPIRKYSSDFVIKSRLELNSLRRLKKNELKDLPELKHEILNLEMNNKQKHSYSTLVKEMKNAPIKERIGYLSKLSIAATSDASGASNKFDQTILLCINAQKKKKKIVIFSNYNNPLSMLMNKILKNNIKAVFIHGDVELLDRHRLVYNFKNDDNITCLLCNSKIGGEGLTLTEASTIIFLNEWWNPSSNRQAEDRINRIGQKEKMKIYLLRSINTIDTHVVDILESKHALEKDFLLALSNKVTNYA